MLSIGNLGQGQERYYLEAVAEGAEDYYVYAGEAPGRWAGGGADSLALAGEVAGADFTAVLRSTDPATGEPLGKQHAVAKVPGFDLTFSAPKSVSLLFALGDPWLTTRMRDAHEVAEDHDDVATASLIENLIDQTEKRTWFLFEAARGASNDGH